ncbi:zinc transport system substrate-binding protein [Pseudobutyrivibrio sp. OR37]|uniref:metal ABC transporter substrate-binding protein n=1 Tax=Pseudobutyrivibrio sp. OR37 TaxID=1798186 RepID=UPI0008E0D6E8|nr:metal ABC transporter substrate-binding protein [Pseudobutyrivibrio sp. OR37]SFH71947.1 zinc transport system substrate-binding protein [Pseudobutyrivibrio sp. OR37]
MKIKNLIGLMAATVFMMGAFAGCGTNSADVVASDASKDGISIVTTIFPEYDWVKEIAGDAAGVEVTNLLDNGADLHNYQPTAEDIKTIATCDLFIYVGGESDEWAEDAIKTAVNPNQKVINLMEVLKDSIKEEEVVEGMQAEEEEEEGEEEVEYDEHVWLSLKNAAVCVDAIEAAMSEIDTANASTFAANADAYVNEIKNLDNEYRDMVDGATTKTVLFGDRFPFRYMVDDYGLDYFAAFVGCSAETEASFETIKFLAEKVDELGLKTVLTIENSDNKIADTIIANTNSKDANILAMDSMQSTTSADYENGVTYLSIMKNNLNVLTEALN